MPERPNPGRARGPRHPIEPHAHDGRSARPRAIVTQGGRGKAYRPLGAPERRAALTAGLAAYDRGDAFLAHELLEPAWMGTADIAERELLQGLIKLAAAFVHAARGNPAGVAKNLRGARARLEDGRTAGDAHGIEVDTLVSRIDTRLASPISADDPSIAIPRRGIPPPAIS